MMLGATASQSARTSRSSLSRWAIAKLEGDRLVLDEG
jgi:hypothetical protein